MADPVQYSVDLTDRIRHLVRVTVSVPTDLAPGARVTLPSWTPGSYVIRNYVHHVQQASATDASGRPIELTMEGTASWRLPQQANGPVAVTLEIYGHELTVRTNHVDDHHALLITAATFPLVDGARGRRHEVTVDAGGERVWSLLPDDGGVFVADDYDHLVDSAFEVGDHAHVSWSTAGVTHRFVWAGHGGHPDLERIARDGAMLTDEAVRLFEGDLPVVGDYTFLTVGWSAGGGGLEHRDGAVLMMPVTTFQDDERYATFQSLLTHEYLHLWNVKRLTPAALVAPDYERPTHSPSLWVAEGWTAYYDELLPARAGVWTLSRYLERTAKSIDGVLRSPAAQLHSVRQASHEAWTKQYVRDENSLNSTVNYYPHGSALAWALDLELRRDDPAGPGLDGLLRSLWRRHGRTAEGYTEHDVMVAASSAAGRDLDKWFQTHVGSPGVPPLEESMAIVGLALIDAQEPLVVPWLGVSLEETDAAVTISAVARGGPAWDAGISGGDILLAVDGQQVLRGQVPQVLAAHAAGAVVELAVFRGPRLLTVPVTLAAPRPARRLVRVDEPSDVQAEAFRAWIGSELGEVGAA